MRSDVGPRLCCLLHKLLHLGIHLLELLVIRVPCQVSQFMFLLNMIKITPNFPGLHHKIGLLQAYMEDVTSQSMRTACFLCTNVFVCVIVCVCVCSRDNRGLFPFPFQAGASGPMHLPDATKLWCIEFGEGKADHLLVRAQWTECTSTHVQSAVNRTANQSRTRDQDFRHAKRMKLP